MMSQVEGFSHSALCFGDEDARRRRETVTRLSRTFRSLFVSSESAKLPEDLSELLNRMDG